MSLLSALLSHFQHREESMPRSPAASADFARRMADYERRLQRLADVVAVVQRSGQYDLPSQASERPEAPGR